MKYALLFNPRLLEEIYKEHIINNISIIIHGIWMSWTSTVNHWDT